MSNENRLIIFDTDMGPDDAWALIMLLKAATILRFKVIGITCVHGNSNIDNVSRNTIRVLEAIERTDIPVFKGASNPLVYDRNVPDHFFGKDGFGDVEYGIEPNTTLIQSENAVAAIYRLATTSKRKVTLIALGPLTNIALALRTYADLPDYIEDIYIMGGNYKGEGNINTAEYNFYQDPDAAYIVLNATKNPIYILPWETMIPPYMNITPEWRFSVLGNVSSIVTKLLNPAEHAYRNEVYYTPADVACVAAFINPSMIKKADKRFATIELNGSLTRGQMVVVHSKEKEANAIIFEQINEDEFKNMMMWTAGHDVNVNFK